METKISPATFVVCRWLGKNKLTGPIPDLSPMTRLETMYAILVTKPSITAAQMI